MQTCQSSITTIIKRQCNPNRCKRQKAYIFNFTSNVIFNAVNIIFEVNQNYFYFLVVYSTFPSAEFNKRKILQYINTKLVYVFLFSECYLKESHTNISIHCVIKTHENLGSKCITTRKWYTTDLYGHLEDVSKVLKCRNWKKFSCQQDHSGCLYA
jgi:hypothetical protein